jgi:hypothetical protein
MSESDLSENPQPRQPPPPGEETPGQQSVITIYRATDLLAYLRQYLGDAFVDWVLGDPGETLSRQQAEVAAAIAEMLKKQISGQPAHFPAEIAANSLASWQSWINTVMGSDLSHLNLAMTRTLRAQSERRDDSDALIDAVIAWESLFGAVSESTLRVSASLARLLHAAGPEREKARDRYSKIYNRRSLIVHGSKKESAAQQIQKDSQDAINAALEAIRTILVRRPDLLALESNDRSVRILMEDYSPARTEDRPLESAPEVT